ncbi:MAG: adenosylcobinamide-phosphate synthase CbiB [Rikenellaceae bacterium]
MEINTTLIVIIIGALLDTLIGDPYWLPHPIRLFGNMISWFEKRLNIGSNRVLKGGATWIVLCVSTYIAFAFIELVFFYNNVLTIAFCSIFFFYGLSNRCLIEEGFKVEKLLQNGDLEGARKQLSMIVGRQTENLSPTKIRSAVVETLSENLSDGVVAPLFYFAIGGIPLMMLYKMINTLDSMVGYKNDRYGDFGFVSAKMDDVANFIPARLTAILMAIVSLSYRAIQFALKYGRSHSSPNSGYPESALAGVLDCRLGGASVYFDTVVEKPYIGENPRELTHRDVVTCALINGKVAALCYVILILLAV